MANIKKGNRSIRVTIHEDRYNDKLSRAIETETSLWCEVGDYLTTDDEIKLITKLAKGAMSNSNGKIEMWGFLNDEDGDGHLWQGMISWQGYDDNNEIIWCAEWKYEHEDREQRESTSWQDLIKASIIDCLSIK